jgi:hypothetical protein
VILWLPVAECLLILRLWVVGLHLRLILLRLAAAILWL